MTGTGACRAAEPERPAQAHATAAAALPVRASAHLAVAAPSGTTAAREYRAAEYAALCEAHECPAPAHATAADDLHCRAAEYAALCEAHECPAPAHATAAAALPVYASAQREAVVLTVFSVQRRVQPSARPLSRLAAMYHPPGSVRQYCSRGRRRRAEPRFLPRPTL